MRLVFLLLFVSVMVVGVVGYVLVQPSVMQRQNEQTANTAVAKAGVQPGMALYKAPSGRTTQDLSGVPTIEVYPSAENGGAR